MANKMLIDAAHPEETRVVVLRGNRVEEFDHESRNRRQLRGNIYLAKVTRVEPSLQAAFVDFGGNRHGFLAFSEIHPDYYQIPVADRQALLEEEAEEAQRAEAAAAADDDDAPDSYNEQSSAYGDEDGDLLSEADTDDVIDVNHDENPAAGTTTQALATSHDDERISAEPDSEESEQAAEENIEPVIDDGKSIATYIDFPVTQTQSDPTTASENQQSDAGLEDVDSDSLEIVHASDPGDPETIEGETADRGGEFDLETEDDGDDEAETDAQSKAQPIDVESVGSEDALEELPQRTRRRRRMYKIQEVIRRRQIILVQVVKEERGNKGAALTTYLSLAGRYTVLMPNTARGGGISRKITNHTDRKRLRQIATDLDVPEGMGLIIRTAGASRTKAEIKRDFEYLLRLWENVRDLTLNSTAPSLVYEEGSLIKRSIRDLYSKEIDEVLVAGDEAYREAKDFMRMLMPSHAKNVQPYKEADPLFVKYRIERQLNSMFSPYVTLRSGGYIVINQTEALVAIDVNSGKATKEHSIEDTAFATNLEAAEEIARQLRLRDLAGLIVIDFIDMDERRNNRNVERRLKECLRNDRARIQAGRISHFGLLEMSRQRLRTGVLEGSTVPCTHCQGTGMIRSTESVALTVLRAFEDTLLTSDPCDLAATTSVEVALYILNEKRAYLKDIEARYACQIAISADETLHGANFTVERVARQGEAADQSNKVVQMDWAYQGPNAQTNPEDSEQDKKRSRRRKRRRGRSNDRDYDRTSQVAGVQDENTAPADTEDTVQAERTDTTTAEGADEGRQRQKRPKRRGRRGGRRTKMAATPQKNQTTSDVPAEGTPTNDTGEPVGQTPDVNVSPAPAEEERKDKPRRPRRRSRTAKIQTDQQDAAKGGDKDPDQRQALNGNNDKEDAGEKAQKHFAKEPAGKDKAEASANGEHRQEKQETMSPPDIQPTRQRKGWWQRRLTQSNN